MTYMLIFLNISMILHWFLEYFITYSIISHPDWYLILYYPICLSWNVVQRRFFNLDSGCNGVVFIQMRKTDGEPGPEAVVQHMMTSIASTRKHISRFASSSWISVRNEAWRSSYTGSLKCFIICLIYPRFILRVLPVEVACYASGEEISRAIKPLIEKNFPVESQSPKKV